MNTEMNKRMEPAKEVEELYLNEDLQGMSESLDRMVMIADYVCDEDDGIAVKDAGGAYIGIKNALDWGLFQRLAAQADAIITGSDYLERVKKMGLSKAQNVLNQYSQGEFKFLGDWREEHGFSQQSRCDCCQQGVGSRNARRINRRRQKIYNFYNSCLSKVRESPAVGKSRCKRY